MDSAGVGEIGGTFGGSPLGCVAAVKVVKMIEEQNLLDRANLFGEKFHARFGKLTDRFPEIGDIRSIGAMCAIECFDKNDQPNGQLVREILAKAHQRGLILMSAGLYGNVIRLLAPLVITDDQIEEGFDVLEAVINECASDRRDMQ